MELVDGIQERDLGALKGSRGMHMQPLPRQDPTFDPRARMALAASRGRKLRRRRQRSDAGAG